MSNTWGPVPLLTDQSSSFSAGSVNPSISALATRTDLLKARMDGFDGTASVGLMYRDTGLPSSDIKKGTIVSYDPDTATYAPASAEWSYSASVDGKLQPSGVSYVAGILLTDVDPADGEAFILCNGVISNHSMVSYLSADGAGDYYLTAGGLASKNPPAGSPRVYCYTKTASGKIIFKPQAPEYGGHTHDKFSLTNQWSTVASGMVPASLANKYAETAKCFKYTVDRIANPALYSILDGQSTNLTMCKNGVILGYDCWSFENSSIFVAVDIGPSDVMELFAISPIVGTSSAITDIVSESSLIKLEKARGVAYLSVDTESEVSVPASGTAVVGLDQNGIRTAPVVSSLHPGLGTTIGQHVDNAGNPVPGAFDIHSDTTLNSSLELNVTNLNGVIFGSTSSSIGYVFPAGTLASLDGSVRIPYSAGRIGARLNILINGRVSALDEFVADIVEYNPVNLTKADRSISTNQSNVVIGSTLSSLSVDLGAIGSDTLVAVKLQSNQTTSVEVLSVSLKLYTTQ